MQEKQIAVLYHANCLDGFGAAFVAWLKYGNMAEYIPMEYGREPPDITDKIIYILDFSFKRDELLKLNEKAKSIIILDHHKTAQEDLKDLDFAIFDMNKSGCVLAAEYFYPDREIPFMLKMIQDRDLWQFNFIDTKAFCEGLRSIPMKFQAWSHVFNNPDKQKDIIKKGYALLQAHNEYVDILLKHKHKMSLANKNGYAINANSKYSSDLGNRLALESSFGCTYFYDGASALWCYSLRSIGDYDVSEIAKFYGGGGHKNAAGFSSNTLIGF